MPVPVTATKQRGLALVTSFSYANIAANFNDSHAIDLSQYTTLLFYVDITAATGTSPTLQADLVALLPDGTRFDFFNAGPKSSTFKYDVGPGLATNVIVPPLMSINWVVAGTTPSISFTVYVYAA